MDNDYCYHNGKYIKRGEATISISSLSIRYAISVFEGIRLYKQADGTCVAFKLSEHIERLRASATYLHIPTTDIDRIPEIIDELIRLNNISEDSYIRACYLLDTPGTIVKFPDTSCLSITIGKMGRKKWLGEGKRMKLKVSSVLKPSKEVYPAAVKSISNYAPSRIELKGALEQGYDMILHLNAEGNITEAPTSIIMFVDQEGAIVTPPLEDNILASITRETIFEICASRNIEVHQRSIPITEANEFKAAFLCGTGLELAPVASIDEIEYDSENDDLMQMIANDFFLLVRNLKVNA